MFVNRVWQWLFGVGIVRTPDNFGTHRRTPEPPRATRLPGNSFHGRRLVDQAPGAHDRALAGLPALDRRCPAIGRGRPRKPPALAGATVMRLDAECLRDAMLAVAGELRLEMRGPTFPAALKTDYGYRLERPTPKRLSTRVPQRLARDLRGVRLRRPEHGDRAAEREHRRAQALFLMNHPFVITQSRSDGPTTAGRP